VDEFQTIFSIVFDKYKSTILYSTGTHRRNRNIE